MDEKHTPSAATITTLVTGVEAAQRLARRRLSDTYMLARAEPPKPLFMTDGDRYRWICANRGDPAIEDALRYSDRDADFNERIDAAIRMSAAGRHYFADDYAARR